ncbi:hypothetical protein BDD12DRAFT_802472 [Trichophaea hybrida]|nr:hypothetical protein BDD12DRAFT_802472 [Trichophaea hybrida]
MCQAALFHTIEIPIEEFNGQLSYGKIRATGEEEWYTGPPRNNWVWVKMARQRQRFHEPAHETLQGHLPYQLFRVFKLQIPSHVLYLAFVLVTKPFHGGLPNTISSMVKVVPVSGENAYSVLAAGHICGAAHLITEVPSASKETNSGWIVNSHIDLTIWNTIYYVMEKELNEALTGGGKRLRQCK